MQTNPISFSQGIVMLPFFGDATAVAIGTICGTIYVRWKGKGC